LGRNKKYIARNIIIDKTVAKEKKGKSLKTRNRKQRAHYKIGITHKT